MTVADKYMSEANRKKFEFIPPEFDKDLFKNNKFLRQEETLNLFPSETAQEQMYCYYNQLSGCSNKTETGTRCATDDVDDKITVRIPMPSEILRNYNFEVNYEDKIVRSDDVNNVYEAIINNNKSIIDSLSEYKVPVPIAKLITKKIIKLSLEYSGECNKL